MAFEYGLYVPRDTFLHRLDPRAKFLLFLAALGISVAFNDPCYILGFAVAGACVYLTLIILGLSARLTLSRYLIMLANSTVFLIACLIFWPPQVVGGQILFTLPFLGWTYTNLGFMFAVGKMFLIVNPITAALIIFSTTRPEDLVHGAMRLRLPYKAGYIVIIAFRFLPTMAREAKQIVEAQMSRGLDLQKGSIFRRAKNFIPIFIPLMVRMIKMTVELGMGMESRCFGSKPKRTFLKELRFRREDALFSAFCILFLFLAVCLRFLGYGQVLL